MRGVLHVLVRDASCSGANKWQSEGPSSGLYDVSLTSSCSFRSVSALSRRAQQISAAVFVACLKLQVSACQQYLGAMGTVYVWAFCRLYSMLGLASPKNCNHQSSCGWLVTFRTFSNRDIVMSPLHNLLAMVDPCFISSGDSV
jgi:hypothetical protein